MSLGFHYLVPVFLSSLETIKRSSCYCFNHEYLTKVQSVILLSYGYLLVSILTVSKFIRVRGYVSYALPQEPYGTEALTFFLARSEYIFSRLIIVYQS